MDLSRLDILKNKEEIIFAYVHGSFLENDFRDIDIAVYLKPIKKYLKYELYVEREIEDIVGYPVDVRFLNNAPLSFRFNVIKNGFLLFSKNEQISSDYESLSMNEYYDFNYFMKSYRSGAFGIEI